MKKGLKKGLKIIFLTGLAGILTVVIIILFPQQLFAKKINYKNFSVYSNDMVDDRIKTVLDDALLLVRKSELYDSTYEYNIILCNNSLYNKIDDKLLGAGRTARSTLKNVLIKVKIEPTRNLAFPTFHKACEENLTELIAHEMIHCLQAHKYGIFKFNPVSHPELWKLEGYPEYISKGKQLSSKKYSLKSDINRYSNLKTKSTDSWILSEDGGCEVPDYYYKGKLMITYLIEVKHMTYDQILMDISSENTIYQEMIQWSKGKIKK
jgi:hypothetical protein